MQARIPSNSASRRGAGGFTLLEVLIALVVLSVGLLGIAGMIVMSLKAGDSSYTRTQATDLAYDIIDRMRGNSLGAQNGNYNVTAPTLVAVPSPTCVGSANTCTSAQLANYDEYLWQQNLATLMPMGVGSVNVVQTGTSWVATVTIYWCDQRAQQALQPNQTPTTCSTSTLSTLASLSVSAGL